ncbi:MAG TPA: PAS domain-containing protein [Bryobacteraceae bacterium]|nr:PAS domain-containing protein [Bryobacteraceae bacterium]
MQRDEITREILDALPAQVALLDASGCIEIVNEAWRKFVTRNGLRADKFAPGSNFLETTKAIHGEGGDAKTSLSSGIRAVLDRVARSFELIYSCQSAPQQFWFRTIVTPISLGNRHCALITRIDITERVLAEQSLWQQVRRHQALGAELSKERERLMTAQAVAKIGSWETDVLSLATSWSVETYRLFEVDSKTFTPSHTSFLEFVHPDDRPNVEDAFQRSLSTRETCSVDHKILLPSGRIKYLTETWRVVTDADGQVKAIGTCQDISERQLSSEMLRESEARLERAQEITGIGSWEIDVQRGQLVLSKQMYIIHGLTPHDDEQLSLKDIEPLISANREKASSWFQRLLAGEKVEPLEASIHRHDGTTRIVNNEARPLFDKTGKVTKISGTQRDVTDARQADHELRQSQLHLALAQQVASIGSAAIDFRTGKWDWSDETYRIYGVERGRFTPSFEGLGALVHPEDRDELLSKPALARMGITPPPIEYRIKRPDGAERILRREAALVRDDSGEVLGIVGTVQDVTDLRAAEREKNFLQAQLRQAQRLEAVGQITGGVAHDFNNLLTVILGNAEVIEKHLAENSALRELAELTRLAAERGADLTRQLLAFSRQQPLDAKPVDIEQLVSGMNKLLKRVLGERVNISTICDPGSWRALIDAPQLENALLNLSVNARDAMPDGGHLTIQAKNVNLDKTYASEEFWLGAEPTGTVSGQYVLISVSDTGMGMDETTKLKAFEPFFTTKDVGKGSGLGLSMVYGFVKQSKGHVRILSKPGRGTTVELYLPKADETAVSLEFQYEESPVLGGIEKILVVEDDELVRRQLTSQLKDLGYNVVSANDGVEALDILRKAEHFDMLFTDVVMPRGINGWELADEAAKLRPNLPVLFASGYAESAVAQRGRLDPGFNLLRKPYRRHEIAAKIRAILDQMKHLAG